MSDLSPLRLSEAQLAGVRDALRDRIRDGLAHRDREIRALPAYLRRASPSARGRAVALDVGGTDMRAGEIEIGQGSARLIGHTVENALMERAARDGIGRDEFFDAQAAMIASVATDDPIAVGYCFSYPATITPEVEAILLEWTKGIRVADTVGQPVGKLLAAALAKRGKRVRAIPVMNDTVASLIAGSALAPDLPRTIGVIVGTGTNMAGFFPVRDIAKLGAEERAGWRDDEPMAVNLESGAFNPPGVLAEWDAALDRSLRPDERNKHQFEKAVSGAYLARLLWHAAGPESCRKAGFDLAAHLNDAAELVRRRDDPLLGEAARLILDRSADLVAAALAGLISVYGSGGEIGILVEGSLFHKTPGYPERVAQRLAALTPGAATRFIDAQSHPVAPNFLGAAATALRRRDSRS